MKKALLLFLAISLIAYSTQAQCTPDPQYTASGVYPDSATGLATSYVGYAYDEIITVVVPADTTTGGTTYYFDRFVITSFTGLPTNFSHTCSPSNCSFNASTSGCLNITSSVNPVFGDIGIYPLTIEVMPYVLIGGFSIPSPLGAVVVDYYYIEIVDSTGVNVGIEKFEDTSFELKTIYPNPVTNISKIQFISGVNTDVTFTVTNLLGKKIENRSISAKRGVNDIYFSADDLSNGIYMYSISSNGKTSTKRMIVRK